MKYHFNPYQGPQIQNNSYCEFLGKLSLGICVLLEEQKASTQNFKIKER